MALDIIETKLFEEKKEIIKKSIPKHRCNLIFKSKTLELINLPKILKSCVIIFHLILIFLIFRW